MAGNYLQSNGGFFTIQTITNGFLLNDNSVSGPTYFKTLEEVFKHMKKKSEEK